jgi:hypothetical protein
VELALLQERLLLSVLKVDGAGALGEGDGVLYLQFEIQEIAFSSLIS